ncbi:DUF1203 domain-containing protein [Phenylobacterium aquaticum]|uniref:DUF1203 domain-containing protein n=1 Tax=Phenylobacterium aquaticum TaxID=1763816 RepID=UPI0026F00751|nr:DUF1203 domain-containing protein [Phenylobacterium aquaticum]
MTYVISGLPVAEFQPLFGLSDTDLAARGVIRMTADAPLGFPCRITLADARPGETLLLLNHEYQPARSPYRGRHAIFVNEAAAETARFVDEVPPVLTVRKAISIRAFDEAGMILDADLAAGDEIEPLILRLLDNPDAAYLHAHNAGRGCYAARIDRS